MQLQFTEVFPWPFPVYFARAPMSHSHSLPTKAEISSCKVFDRQVIIKIECQRKLCGDLFIAVSPSVRFFSLLVWKTRKYMKISWKWEEILPLPVGSETNVTFGRYLLYSRSDDSHSILDISALSVLVPMVNPSPLSKTTLVNSKNGIPLQVAVLRLHLPCTWKGTGCACSKGASERIWIAALQYNHLYWIKRQSIQQMEVKGSDITNPVQTLTGA